MSNSEVKTSREYAELRDHIWKLVKDEASQTNREIECLQKLMKYTGI